MLRDQKPGRDQRAKVDRLGGTQLMCQPFGVIGNPVIQPRGEREQSNQMSLEGVGQPKESAITP
jgi:hypothetical protein